MKIISIVVPTYDMENYLGRCLTSVLDHEWEEVLEVIVVNDGSKDRSLQIASEYRLLYPETVVIIDKENGHYGSCINAALPVARGKYMKILDADDWFDKKEFGRFVEHLKHIEGDLIVTNYTFNYASGRKKSFIYHKKEYHAIYNLSNMSFPSKLLDIPMHAAAFDTELLRGIDYRQTEGILYTDQEWTFYPMFAVNTVVYVNADVYQYFIGRKGQSTDKSVWTKCCLHNFIIMERMIRCFSSFGETMSGERKRYLLRMINNAAVLLYRYYLLFVPNELFDEIRKYDRYVNENDSLIQFDLFKVHLHRYLPFPVLWYWKKFSKRIPSPIIRMLIRLNDERRFRLFEYPSVLRRRAIAGNNAIEIKKNKHI